MVFLNALVYIAYEFICFLASFRLAQSAVGVKDMTSRRFSEWLLPSLFFSVIFNYAAALILSFARFNHPWAYLSAALFFLVAVYHLRLDQAREIVTYYSETIRNINVKVVSILALILVVAVPLIASNIRPIEETDSLVVLNQLINYFHNLSDSYSDNYSNFSLFWELNYLPSLVITHSDKFFWWISLKAIAMMFLALYLIAYDLGMDSEIGLVMAAAGIMILHLWEFSSGIGTLKNDVIFNVGFLTVVLGGLKLIKQGLNRFNALLVCFGLVGMTVKLNGYTLSVLSLVLIAVFARKHLLHAKLNAFAWLAWMAVSVLLTNGHYVLRTLILYGNPVYPARVSLFGRVIFNGVLQTADTSVASHIFDPNLWQVLFRWANIGGLFLPISFLVGLTFPVVYLLVSRVTRLYGVGSGPDTWQPFLVAICWVAWVNYIFTPYTAGTNFGYLYYLSSFRYITGAIGLADIIVLDLLRRQGADARWIMAAAGILVGSKAQHVVDFMFLRLGNDSRANYVLVLGAILTVLIALLAVVVAIRFRPILAIGVPMCVVGALMAGSYFFELNRPSWLEYWKPAWEKFLDSPGLRVGVVYNPTEEYRCSALSNTYPVVGRNFQNDVHLVNENSTGDDIGRFDYLVRLQNPNCPSLKTSEEFAQRAMRKSFVPEVVTDFVVVAHNAKSYGEQCVQALQSGALTHSFDFQKQLEEVRNNGCSPKH